MLDDPVVVGELAPFVVTSWHGHRDDDDVPAAVQEVWREKFRPGRGPGRPRQSNVDLAMLDPKGRVVHHFDGFPQGGPGREGLGAYALRELRRGQERLDEPPPKVEERPLVLPDVGEGQSGVRVFVRLMDERMRAYQAPVVEAVDLDEKGWAHLARPRRAREVEAGDLAAWLGQVYPPGVMERTDPKTKEVYRVASVSGTLDLAPLEPAEGLQRAVLSGRVRLTDEGPDDFGWEGDLEVLLTYRKGESAVHSLRGVFEGVYPRYDRVRRVKRDIPLQAVFESRPN
jgi:hypothetical protein